MLKKCPNCGFDLMETVEGARKKFFILRAQLPDDIRKLMDKCLKSIASVTFEYDSIENYHVVVRILSLMNNEDVVRYALNKYIEGRYWESGKYQRYLMGIINGTEKSWKQKKKYDNRIELPTKTME